MHAVPVARTGTRFMPRPVRAMTIPLWDGIIALRAWVSLRGLAAMAAAGASGGSFCPSSPGDESAEAWVEVWNGTETNLPVEIGISVFGRNFKATLVRNRSMGALRRSGARPHVLPMHISPARRAVLGARCAMALRTPGGTAGRRSRRPSEPRLRHALICDGRPGRRARANAAERT